MHIWSLGPYTSIKAINTLHTSFSVHWTQVRVQTCKQHSNWSKSNPDGIVYGMVMNCQFNTATYDAPPQEAPFKPEITNQNAWSQPCSAILAAVYRHLWVCRVSIGCYTKHFAQLEKLATLLLHSCKQVLSYCTLWTGEQSYFLTEGLLSCNLASKFF